MVLVEVVWVEAVTLVHAYSSHCLFCAPLSPSPHCLFFFFLAVLSPLCSIPCALAVISDHSANEFKDTLVRGHTVHNAIRITCFIIGPILVIAAIIQFVGAFKVCSLTAP